MLSKNLNPSSKIQGKRELQLISVISDYFSKKDFEVVTHRSFNIAWGNIISDLDVILLNNNDLTYIEVKSKKDKIKKAYEQIEKVKDFIDYAWIASDKKYNKINNNEMIGYMKIDDDEIIIIKKPKRFISEPKFSSILSLKKKCLLKFNYNNLFHRNMLKYDIAKKVYEMKDVCTRECVKEIVTCGGDCDENCPISNYITNRH